MTRRALPILILAILALSMIPVLPVMGIGFDTPAYDAPDKYKGKTVKVYVVDVTAGYDVELYWDKVKSWDGEAGLLNTTEASAAGEAEIWFDVPEAVAGDHYLWIVDTKTADTDSVVFTVETHVKLSASSGLEGDKVTVTGYHFGEEKDTAIVLAVDPTTGSSDTQSIGTADGVETDFSDTIDDVPILPGSVSVTGTGAGTLTDNGDGTLDTTGVGEGTINYITGDIEVSFDTAPTGYGPITCSYEYFEDIDDAVYVLAEAVEASDLGTVSRRVTVPDLEDMDYGAYKIYAFDEKGNEDDEDFAIGAVISLDVEEGPVGTLVEIRGRGFDDTQYVQQGEVVITDGVDPVDCYIIDMPTAGVDIDADDEFDLEIFIPQVTDMEDYDTITVSPGTYTASHDFEVTGLAEIEVDPEFGVQGTKIDIEGYNFTAESGEEVSLELWIKDFDPDDPDDKVADIKEFDTDSDGEFSGTFVVPAVSSGPYELRAMQADYNIDADTAFRVGLMIVILSPDEGPTGTKVTLTGTGFTENKSWNATFNGITLVEDGDVDGAGNLKIGTAVPTFFVPTVDVGTYTVHVIDVDTEIDVEVEFEVTETTIVETDPVEAPNEYNVTIEGWYFTAEEETDLEFVLWNATDDWDMEVEYGGDPVETDEDGNFTGYWEVPDSDTLSIGEYTINVTDDNDLYAQVIFNVVSKKVAISPRKSEFAITESVSFIIESSFAQIDSYIKIWDPDDNLVWRTDDFVEDYWLKVGVVQTLPYYRQTAGGNPMTLLEDAPLGTWSYTWYDEDDDELDDGTFTVVAAPARVLEERIGGLEDIVSGISDDVSGLADVISGVQSDLSDVKSDLADARAAVDAAKAAADDAAAAVSDVAAVAERAADSADAAKESAGQAAEAVDEIQRNVGGLSTLVYGAIGASLVAALAAIVSLMQISRRIAG